MSYFEKMGITQCVCMRVRACVRVKINVSTSGKYHTGVGGVRPEECVKLDGEESTQRAAVRGVNIEL